MFNKFRKFNIFKSVLFTPKFLFIAAFIILNVYIAYNTYVEHENQKKYFRIHVVANSDSIEDQLLKYKIADKVDKYISSIIPDTACVSKDTSKAVIKSNIQEILDICYSETNKSNLSYPVYANIGNMYYEEKVKDSIHMDSGTYDSLKIVIGSGKGQNWWSLIYPNAYDAIVTDENELDKKTDDTTHLSTSDLISSENISYKFGIIEFFKKLFK